MKTRVEKFIWQLEVIKDLIDLFWKTENNWNVYIKHWNRIITLSIVNLLLKNIRKHKTALHFLIEFH